MPRTSTAASAAKVTEVVEESIFDAPVSKPTPAPKQAAKFKVRREEKEKSVSEYKTVKKSGSIFIMAQKNVTIIDDGRVREIRYCPSEPSIFKDEQESDARRAPVMFTEGRIFVRPDQPNLKEFLDRHPDNTANGGKRFYLVDETKQKKVEIEKEYVMVDAINMIRTRPLDDLLAVATGLNINVDRPVEEIKHDLLVFAKKNPKNFIDSFDNPIVEMRAKLSQASKYQIISISQDGVRWFDTNKLIVSVPAGKDPMDVMVRYCLTDAASPVVTEIERQLGN